MKISDIVSKVDKIPSKDEIYIEEGDKLKNISSLLNPEPGPKPRTKASLNNSYS